MIERRRVCMYMCMCVYLNRYNCLWFHNLLFFQEIYIKSLCDLLIKLPEPRDANDLPRNMEPSNGVLPLNAHNMSGSPPGGYPATWLILQGTFFLSSIPVLYPAPFLNVLVLSDVKNG